MYHYPQCTVQWIWRRWLLECKHITKFLGHVCCSWHQVCWPIHFNLAFFFFVKTWVSFWNKKLDMHSLTRWRSGSTLTCELSNVDSILDPTRYCQKGSFAGRVLHHKVCCPSGGSSAACPVRSDTWWMLKIPGIDNGVALTSQSFVKSKWVITLNKWQIPSQIIFGQMSGPASQFLNGLGQKLSWPLP